MKLCHKSWVSLLAIIATVLLSGCNTVKGFGQDMQAGGQQLQQAAQDNK